MPIYEYYCNKCRKRMSWLVLTPATFQPQCKFCGSDDIERLFSRFASPKSEESRLESLADPANMSGLDETDPASVARWVKKMGSEIGEDFAGEDIDQLAEEAAREASGGEDPGDIGESTSDDL
jgi:putative FmdB family regulatory protein